MIKREISNIVTKLAKQYPVVTITGPRQSGKTTLVKKIFPDKAYVNFEKIEIREFAIDDPNGFIKKYKNGAIIDEVQKAPEILSYIQAHIDDVQKENMFILTGSSQFKLMASISQSLAGRTALLKLLPFSYNETQKYKKNCSLDELIYTGFFPRIYDKKLNPTQALSDYFETYIERDIRQLSQIHNLTLFTRFVKLCAGRIGQILNLNSLANDTGINHTTAREWLSLLETSYVVFLLEPFWANINKRLIKSPKLYFYDVGLASYLMGIESINHIDTHPLKGNLFENMIIIEFLKARYNNGKKNNLHFFRDSNGNEIDLLYKIAQYFIPIEIKSGATINSEYFKGFKAIYKIFKKYPYGQGLIYTGDRNDIQNEIQILNYKNINKFISSFSKK